MMWLCYNRLTGEGRAMPSDRAARRYARKRGWTDIWIGLFA